MTKTEKIKLLATEVMGWTLGTTDVTDHIWFDKDKRIVGNAERWNPYPSSADNDALIEAFVGKHTRGWVKLYLENKYIEVEVTKSYGADKHTEAIDCDHYTTSKKNEAVCEAILKAVAK